MVLKINMLISFQQVVFVSAVELNLCLQLRVGLHPYKNIKIDNVFWTNNKIKLVDVKKKD